MSKRSYPQISQITQINLACASLLLICVICEICGCTQISGQQPADVFTQARSEISPPKDFKIAVRNTTVSRDEDAGRAVCTVALGVSWDSRLKPLLLQRGAVTIAFAKDASGKTMTGMSPAQGSFTVAGRTSAEIKVQVPAAPRSSPQIDRIKGQLLVTTPAKMLNFEFAPLKAHLKKTIEGVTVTVAKVSVSADRWSVEVIVENPKSTPEFETFQTSVWLENNRLTLFKGAGKSKVTMTPRANDEELLDALTPRRARIRYHFHQTAEQPLGRVEDWTLSYQTPGPIVEVAVPFELTNIPLP